MPRMEPTDPVPAWIGAEELPVEFANVFTGVVGANAVFVNIGSAVPPIVETEEQLENMRFIPIKPIARLALTPGNLDDMIEALENTRENYRELKRTLEEDDD